MDQASGDDGSSARMPSHMLVRVIGFLAVLSGCLLILGIIPAAENPTSEVVEINIGERGYLIPKNYLGVVRPSRSAHRHERAVLWLTWPGMEPRTKANAHLWKRRMPRRQIRIHIEAQGTETYDKLQNLIRLGELDLNPEEWDYGLARYAKKEWQFFVVKDRTFQTPLGKPLAFKCNDVSPRTRELFEVELLCISEYMLPDGSWIIVHFFLANLDQWREIDASARALMDRLRR